VPIDPSDTTRYRGGESLEFIKGTYTPPVSDQTHYLSLQEAATLGYGAYSTLHRWTRDGRLPSVKIGGRVKVLRRHLDALATPNQAASFESIEDAVQRLVAAAPPLAPEQTRRLRDLLGGA
jgi:excisionase family DNA binding protein